MIKLNLKLKKKKVKVCQLTFPLYYLLSAIVSEIWLLRKERTLISTALHSHCLPCLSLSVCVGMYTCAYIHGPDRSMVITRREVTVGWDTSEAWWVGGVWSWHATSILLALKMTLALKLKSWYRATLSHGAEGNIEMWCFLMQWLVHWRA